MDFKGMRMAKESRKCSAAVCQFLLRFDDCLTINPVVSRSQSVFDSRLKDIQLLIAPWLSFLLIAALSVLVSLLSSSETREADERLLISSTARFTPHRSLFSGFSTAPSRPMQCS